MLNNLKYKDITEKIIGCSFEVHKTLKNGFQEIIYQRCLAIEFDKNSISYELEKEMAIYYKGRVVGIRRVDFLIEGIIPLEIKAVSLLEDVHLAQAKNYLESYNLEVGLLINFGTKSLEVKRLFNKKYAN